MAPYESAISFTLDTICPWTYLAKKRLDEALRRIQPETAGTVSFTVRFLPYQLYPGASLAGEDKYEWYKKSRYGDSEEKMEMYVKLMTAYGQTAGIPFTFHGLTANTLPAHHLIHYTQTHHPTKTSSLINALYRRYFEQEQHPSSRTTLLAAAEEAGLGEQGMAIAKAVGWDESGGGKGEEANIGDWDLDDGERETKALIREQAADGVDSVPTIVLEGKRRDLTLQGAKEVEEYVKALKQIIKESS